MWWNGQNLDKPVTGKDGTVWHFRVWHDQVNGVYTQRIFFWDDAKTVTGKVELAGKMTRHISRLKGLCRKLVSDATFREKFYCDLAFPLQKNY